MEKPRIIELTFRVKRPGYAIGARLSASPLMDETSTHYFSGSPVATVISSEISDEVEVYTVEVSERRIDIGGLL